MRLRIIGLLALLLIAGCNGADKQKKKKTPAPDKGRAQSKQPGKGAPLKSGTAWVQNSPPFRLVADPKGQIFVGAEGPLHAGLEIYQVQDRSLLRWLVGTDGLDGRKLTDACARAISRSPLTSKPKLTQSVAPGAPAGLRLMRYTRFSVVDPLKTARLPLTGLGPGLYLVCLRSGGRVAMMPLGLGGPRITALHSRGRTLALLSQSRKPLGGQTLLQVTAGRVQELKTGVDGVALWAAPGKPQLIAARSGAGWGVAYLATAGPPPVPTSQIHLSAEAVYPADLLRMRIHGSKSLSGPLWLVGPAGRRLLRYVGVGPGRPARISWRVPLDLRPGPHHLLAELGTDAGDWLRTPLRIESGFRAAAVLQTRLSPAQPVAGKPVRLTVTLKSAARFALQVTRWSIGPAGARVELDRRRARVTGGTVTLKLGGWPEGEQLVSIEARLPGGGRCSARLGVWVLPAAGHAVRADRAVYPPGGPISCRLISRQRGEHKLELQLQTGPGTQRLLASQQVAVSGRTQVLLHPTEAGRMRLRLIAPDGSSSLSGWFLTAGQAKRSPIEQGLAVGQAIPGQGWPVILRLRQPTCYLVLTENARSSSHRVLIGRGQGLLPGRVPAGDQGAARVRLASWTGQWRADQPVLAQAAHYRDGQLVAPSGFSGLIGWRRLRGADPTAGPPTYQPTRIEVDSRTETQQLYQLRLGSTELQAFMAITALSRKDYRKAAEITQRILAAFPQHKLARSVLRRARRGLASQGIASGLRKPLARLRATRLTPNWQELPLSAVVAELRDASGVLLELEVRHPHQTVTLTSSVPSDADTLLRTVLGRLGLAYRAIPGGFKIHEEVPEIRRKKDRPAKTNNSHRSVLLTYRLLSTAPLARSVRQARQLAAPPGGPWEALLWPASGMRGIRLPIHASARLDGVLPAFLRPGDRCVTPLTGAGVRLFGASDGMKLTGKRLALSPTRGGTLHATLFAGKRRRLLAIPVLATSGGRQLQLGVIPPDGLTLEGPGLLLLDGDRLALVIRLIRAIRPASGPRAEVVRQWCRMTVEQLCKTHKLTTPDFKGLPTLASSLGPPIAGSWGSPELTALLHHDLVRLSSAGVAVPPGFTEPTRPRLEQLLADASKPMSWRAAALMALAAEQMQPRKLSEIGALKINATSSLALARLLRAVLYTRDRASALQLARALAGQAIRRDRHWVWTTAGRDVASVTAEVAAALLTFDPQDKRAQNAVDGLILASGQWRGQSILPVLQAIVLSMQGRIPRPAGRLTIRINAAVKRLALATGQSIRIPLGAGKSRILPPADRSLNYVFSGAAAPTKPLPILRLQWSASPGKLSVGKRVQLKIDLGAHRPGGLRRLELHLLPGCRIRLAQGESRLIRHELDRLILVLAPGDGRELLLELTPAISGQFLLPGPRLTDLLGRAIATAPATKVQVGP